MVARMVNTPNTPTTAFCPVDSIDGCEAPPLSLSYMSEYPPLDEDLADVQSMMASTRTVINEPPKKVSRVIITTSSVVVKAASPVLGLITAPLATA